MGFLRGGVWIEATPKGRGLGIKLPEHSRLLEYMDARGWGVDSTQTVCPCEDLACMCRCPWRAEEGVGYAGTGVKDGCDTPDVDVGI